MPVKINSSNLINYYRNIEETAEHLKASTAEDLTKVFETAKEMKQKHETYLKAHNCLIRFFLNLLRHKHSVHGAYLHSKKALIRQLVSDRADNMLSLLSTKYSSKERIVKKLSTKALAEAVAAVRNCKEAKGFVWKVTNDKNTSSYLIGTMHRGLKSMSRIPAIKEAIKNAEQFYSEVGEKTLQAKHGSKFSDYVMDLYIAKQARNKKKKNRALDNFFLRMEAENAERQEKAKTPPQADLNTAKTHPRMKKSLEKEAKLVIHHQFIANWQRGDAMKLRNDIMLKRGSSAACDYRTKGWLPKLLPTLQEATKPVCMFVGLGHCDIYGVRLVDEFKKAGLKVEQMSAHRSGKPTVWE